MAELEFDFYVCKFALCDALRILNEISKRLKTLLNQSCIDSVKDYKDFPLGHSAWKKDSIYYIRFMNLDQKELEILKEIFPNLFKHKELVVGGIDLSDKGANFLPSFPPNQKMRSSEFELEEFSDELLAKVVEKSSKYIDIVRALLFDHDLLYKKIYYKRI